MEEKGSQNMSKGTKLFPGQLYEFISFEGITFCYLLLSRDKHEDGRELWACASFMNWGKGAAIKYRTEEEILEMKYIGKIQTFRRYPGIKRKRCKKVCKTD